MHVFLKFLPPTAAGNGISICQAIYRDFCFVSARAFASPVNGSFAISSPCRFDRCQPAECLSCNILICCTDRSFPKTSTASDPTILQPLLFCDLLIPTITFTQPHGSLFLRWKPFDCCQSPKSLPGNIFCRLTARTHSDGTASTALDCSSRKFLAAGKYNLPAVTSTSPYDVTVVPLVGWL